MSKMQASPCSISVEEYVDNAEPYYAIKIGHAVFELNVYVERKELPLFSSVPAADWDKRGSVRIGRSAGLPAFWSTSGDTVSILVGHDDETWDFAVGIPMQSFAEIVRELTQVSGEAVGPDDFKGGSGGAME